MMYQQDDRIRVGVDPKTGHPILGMHNRGVVRHVQRIGGELIYHITTDDGGRMSAPESLSSPDWWNN